MSAQGLEEAEQLLVDLAAVDREDETLEENFAYSQAFFDELGNPQDAFPSIHVAGTSGKGSTTHYLSGILAGHGFRIGTMISPHISDVRERAQIDLDLPDESQFINAANRSAAAVMAMVAEGRGNPRFDELFASVGFIICENADIDYAVVETDMGGRFDATNTMHRQDKHAVITSLGLDHEGSLGRTVEEIAWQKAGIIRPAGQASAFRPTSITVEDVLTAEARIKRAELDLVDPADITSGVRVDAAGVVFDYESGDLKIPDIHLQTIASYQVMNTALAISSIRMLAERDGFSIDPQKTREALGQVRIPARLETASINGREAMIDGSTNPQKLGSFIRALKDAGIGKPVWVFGAGAKKDHEEIFSVVSGYAEGIVFSDYDRKQAPHMQGKSADAKELAKKWRKLMDIPCVGAAENVNEAFLMACEKTDETVPIAVAGSIYMIGEFNRAEVASVVSERAAAKAKNPKLVAASGLEPLTSGL